MPVPDYTAKVPVAKTVAEIEAKLANAKAEAILKEYDKRRDRFCRELSVPGDRHHEFSGK